MAASLPTRCLIFRKLVSSSICLVYFFSTFLHLVSSQYAPSAGISIVTLERNTDKSLQIVKYSPDDDNGAVIAKTSTPFAYLVTEQSWDGKCWVYNATVNTLSGTSVFNIECSNDSSFPISRAIQLPITNSQKPLVYAQLDPALENVYWKQRGDHYIWATSLISGKSRHIAHTPAAVTDNPLDEIFRIDTSLGLIFHILLSVYPIPPPEGLVNPTTKSIPLPSGQSLRTIRDLAIDTSNHILYLWSESAGYSQIFAAAYANDGTIKQTTIHKSFQSFPKRSRFFQYNNRTFYWLANDNSIMSLNIGNNQPVSVFGPNSNLVSFSIYESTKPAIRRTYSPPKCDQLELPVFGGKSSCFCHLGYFYRNNICVPPSVLFHTNNNILKLIQGPDSPGKGLVPCETFDHPNATDKKFCDTLRQKIIETGSQSKIRIQFDPYSLGYLLENTSSKCMSYHNFKDDNVTTLYCIPQDHSLRSSAMDFHLGTLFWLQTKEGDNEFRLHSRRISTGHFPKPFVPFGGVLSSLTIDPEHNTLFWVHEGNKLIKTHYKDDEVLKENNITDLKSDAILHAYNSHVLWTYSWTNDTLVSTPGQLISYDIIARKQKQILDNKIPIQDFYILPQPNRKNPCAEAKCTHICIPHDDTLLNLKYICACPDGMILAPDNSCQPIQLLLMTITNPSRPSLFHTWDTFNSNSTMASLPTSPTPLIASNFNTRTICSHDSLSGTTQCVAPGGKPFHVPQVHKNTSFLLIDETGTEIFWNNGNPACISIKSLIRNLRITFPCFPAPGILPHVFVLDTRRKLFFWANDKPELCMKTLYNQKSSSASIPTKIRIFSITLDIASNHLYYTGTSSSGLIYRLPYSAFKGGDTTPTELIPNQHQNIAAAVIKFHQNYIMFKKDAIISIMSLSNMKVIPINPPISNKTTILDIFGPFYFNNLTANRCDGGYCSEFCFPDFATSDVNCACSDGRLLGEDHTTCHSIKLSTAWIVGITMMVFVVIAAIIVAVTISVMRRNRDIYLEKVKKEFSKGDPRRAGMTKSTADAALYLPLPVSYIIQPSEVTVDNDSVLGEGQYGTVIKGTYKRNQVAIKTFKSLDLNIVVEFTKEIKIMAYIGDHPHVVHFYGAVVGRGYFYAVMELSTFGCLKDYLVEKLKPSSNQPLKEEQRLDLIAKLLTWSEHIACGMEHLVQKKVVHGDLATRNVLLFPRHVAKVIDFGLARNYDPAYNSYQKRNLAPLPWKWMDYDALKRLNFSSESDVWAFGVTMWEIFTFGDMPFPQYEWNDCYLEALEQNVRLSKPKYVPEEIYNTVMMPCWSLSRADRPTFTQIIRQLKEYSARM